MTAALLAATWLLAAPATLTVSVGGPPEDPAYLPVHAAAALGTFEAEGLAVTLRRARHPTAALEALRAGEAAVAVTTTDQAIRGGWARGTPVRILVAHTRTPGVGLLVAPRQRAALDRLEALRGRRLGIPAPGTTAHLALVSLLRGVGIEPWQVELVSLGGPGLVRRLGTGELDAAMVEEPWLTRALAAGHGALLLDLRDPAVAARHLGGPVYEVVSVVPADAGAPASAPALEAYARAVLRVQAWLARTPAAEVAARLPPELVRDRAGFVAALAARRDGLAPTGEATAGGLETTFRVLRAGSPWPGTLTVRPRDLVPPPFVAAVRDRLGSEPPPP